jgi:hypothetical protein
MAYLSDTARVVLAAAAQRDDLSILPFPDGVKAKGGAEQKVLAGLRKRGFIRVIETPGRPQRIVLTSEGMAAIGVEPDDDETGDAGGAPGAATADSGQQGAAEAQDATTAHQGPEAQPEPTQPAETRGARGDSAPPPAKGRAKAAKPRKAAPVERPTPRSGTKQALMIEMLKRPEGTTVEQIAEATGWQKHTIRGAISGALKKKLGLVIEATRTREVGPNKPGAKGSATVYRITGPATGPQPANGSGTETP